MDQPWQIELFGWLRATQGERVVARFRTQRAGTLLAYLAYHLDRSHPREALIELLWPESDRHLGRISLRTELTSLRRQLEPPGVPPGAVLLADRATVRLNPAACVTDVAQFEAALAAAKRTADPAERAGHLTRAAERYRGELLPGCFEEWVLQERQRLAEAFLQGLHELVGLLEAQGDVPGALRWARRAVTADPLGEESHQRLIRLLLESGQVEAARSQFEQSEHLLLRDLGTGLSPEIRAMIRDQARAKDRPPSPPAGRRGAKRRLPSPSPATDEAAEAAPPAPSSTVAPPPSENLPLRFTRFFGRERELEQLRRLLQEPDTRLVTMTGPGGTGKTRLALQVAHQLRDAFPGRVWYVSLRDLTDPALIPDQIVLALRLPRTPQSEPLEQVEAFLSRAPSLLVIDNYEHLVGRGAESAQQLLERVEALTVLVTSRRCLGLEGEREFPVAPLPIPDPSRDREEAVVEARTRTLPHGRGSDVASGISYPSVALFVDRAQAVRPDFQVTSHNATAVATLCQRLEGLPLAIELAAARSGVLTPQQMLSRLQQRFDLLVRRQGSADPRHQSLRAAIDWSYQLLSPELQRFFTRLSIFRGGWSLEAAEAVCEEPLALGHLEHLRECSLVQVTETAGGTAEASAGVMRFQLLETLREYGWEQLAPQERSALGRRHLQFFLSLAGEVERYLAGPEAGHWLDQLEREHDNLRAALAWTCSGEVGSEDLELGLQLAGRLVDFWSWRGYHREGRDQLLRLLARPGAARPTVGRAFGLRGAAHFAQVYGDLPTARTLGEESLAVWRGLDNPVGIASALESLGEIVHRQGDREGGRALLEESLAIYREQGDRMGIANCLNSLARAAYEEEHMPAARALAEETLATGRELGNRLTTAASLMILVRVAQFEQDLTSARALSEEALAIRRELGDRGGIADILGFQAAILELDGKLSVAQALSEESLAIQREREDRSGLAAALQHRGAAAYRQRDLPAARARFAESLAIRRELGEQGAVADLLACLAEVARQEWDIPAARVLADEGLAIRRKLGDRCAIAQILFTTGWITAEEGDFAVARAQHEESLALKRELNDPKGMIGALDSIGCMAFWQGDLKSTRERFEEALAISRQVNQKPRIAWSLRQLGGLAEMEGDYSAATALLEQALTLWRGLEEPSGVMATLFFQGWTRRRQGDHPSASAVLSEMFALAREHRWRGSAVTPLYLLGEVAGDAGDWERAAVHLTDAVQRCRSGEGHHPQALPQCLSGMARVALARERPVRAARLLGATFTLWTARGPSAWEIEPRARRDRDRNIAAARTQLSEDEFAAAWAAGQAMSVEQAIAEALREAPAG